MANSVRMSITYDLRGGWEIDKTLAELPMKMRKRALRSALTKAGNLIKKRARQLVPRSKGAAKSYRKSRGKKPLYQTIGTKIRTYPKSNGGDVFLSVIGPEYPAGAHGHLVEFGHEIVGHKPKQVKTGRRSREIPFMQPAFEDMKGQVQRELETKVREFVNRNHAKNNG